MVLKSLKRTLKELELKSMYFTMRRNVLALNDQGPMTLKPLGNVSLQQKALQVGNLGRS